MHSLAMAWGRLRTRNSKLQEVYSTMEEHRALQTEPQSLQKSAKVVAEGALAREHRSSARSNLRILVQSLAAQDPYEANGTTWRPWGGSTPMQFGAASLSIEVAVSRRKPRYLLSRGFSNTPQNP